MNVERLSLALYFLTNLRNVPILGICFGCQLINVVHWGTMSAMPRIIREKYKVKGCEQQFWFNDRIDKLGIGVTARAHVTIDGLQIPST